MKKKTLLATGVATLLASGIVLANSDNATHSSKKKTNPPAIAKKAAYQVTCGQCGAANPCSSDDMCGAGCGSGMCCGTNPCSPGGMCCGANPCGSGDMCGAGCGGMCGGNNGSGAQ